MVVINHRKASVVFDLQGFNIDTNMFIDVHFLNEYLDTGKGFII